MLPKIWFDIRNLQKISFQTTVVHFFIALRLLGENLAQRWLIFMHFLSGFSAYSGQPVDRFRWNLVRSEIKWTQSRRKRLQVNIFSHFEDIQAQSRQKRPKIDQNLWMIQKIFVKNFFGLNVSKWSNSKSYHVKSEIWGPSTSSSLMRPWFQT